MKYNKSICNWKKMRKEALILIVSCTRKWTCLTP